MAVEVSVSGPIFDGRAGAAAAVMIDQARHDVAAQAYSEWMGNLNRSIRNPTPYYETQITVQKLSGLDRVHDRGIVYGPWLEGTSSRNQSSSFKGYRAAARAELATEAKAQAIVEHAVERFIGRMG